MQNSYTHPLNGDIIIYYLYIDMSNVINSDILFIHFWLTKLSRWIWLEDGDENDEGITEANITEQRL